MKFPQPKFAHFLERILFALPRSKQYEPVGSFSQPTFYRKVFQLGLDVSALSEIGLHIILFLQKEKKKLVNSLLFDIIETCFNVHNLLWKWNRPP